MTVRMCVLLLLVVNTQISFARTRTRLEDVRGRTQGRQIVVITTSGARIAGVCSSSSPTGLEVLPGRSQTLVMIPRATIARVKVMRTLRVAGIANEVNLGLAIGSLAQASRWRMLVVGPLLVAVVAVVAPVYAVADIPTLLRRSYELEII